MTKAKEGVPVQFTIAATLNGAEDKAAWETLTRQVRDLCAAPKYDAIKPDFT